MEICYLVNLKIKVMPENEANLFRPPLLVFPLVLCVLHHCVLLHLPALQPHTPWDENHQHQCFSSFIIFCIMCKETYNNPLLLPYYLHKSRPILCLYLPSYNIQGLSYTCDTVSVSIYV